MSNHTIYQSFVRLKAYCESAEFKGYDPYDGLNSRLFQALPVLPRIRLVRLVWIQFFKRSPLNLRRWVGIQPEYNPKALGLFLSAYSLMHRRAPSPATEHRIRQFASRLMECDSKGFSGTCWGYNFDWESRAFFQPKFTPTIVATSFIAQAFLDAYEATGDESYLKIARSACDFIIRDLNRSTDEKGGLAFSYSPIDQTKVFNASLLGARLFARVYTFTREQELLDLAAPVVQYCCDQQKPDGSWAYSTLPFHQWIDSFHTGYNLECISDYMAYSGDQRFKEHLHKGFDYYLRTFFTPEGVPRYYSNSTYPIDIHCPSQLVMTLKKLGQLDRHQALVDRVLEWTIRKMQGPQGFFYYQINKYFTSRIPYMRWSQAWMFLSMVVYLDHFGETRDY